MHHGVVELSGRLSSGVAVRAGDRQVLVPACALRVEVAFTGGPEPRIDVVGFDAEGMAVDGQATAAVVLCADADGAEGEALHVDGKALQQLMLDVLERFSDVSMVARAEPEGELVLHLGQGVRVHVPRGAVLELSGATAGGSTDLVLSEPLVVAFGGEGLRLSHEQFKFLSRLASVRLSQATLHPDGSVDLEGHGSRWIDVALRVPLAKASTRLSDLIRQSPNFHRLRAFLRHRS